LNSPPSTLLGLSCSDSVLPAGSGIPALALVCQWAGWEGTPNSCALSVSYERELRCLWKSGKWNGKDDFVVILRAPHFDIYMAEEARK
jgi:hypothetical protein